MWGEASLGTTDNIVGRAEGRRRVIMMGDVGRWNTATGGVYRGRTIFQVHPAYPAGAEGAVGDVSVEVTISKEGRVVSARCSAGHPALQKGAHECGQPMAVSPDTAR